MSEKQFLSVVEGEEHGASRRKISIPLARRLYEIKPKESIIDRLVRSLADAAKQIAEPLWELVVATQSKGGSGRLPSVQSDYNFRSWQDIRHSIQCEVNVAALGRLAVIEAALERAKSLLLANPGAWLLSRWFPSHYDKDREKQICLAQIDEILEQIAVTRLIRIAQQQEQP